MITLALVLVSAYLLISALNLFTTIRGGFDHPPRILGNEELPDIAVLVAARNEEHNIARCLNSLVNLDYPEEKLCILVGNDQSTDHTGSIVAGFEKRHRHIKQVQIDGTIGKARGKANVLAQLAHQTRAEYLLITDADIEVRPGWAKTLISFFRPETGIVSGTTIVKPHGFFGTMQQTDWLYFMGLLQTFERSGVHSTAVGNNMAVKREAYLATGGYEHFDFSVTEDYKLFREVRRQGWQTLNMVNGQAVNLSAPAPDFKTLLNQRKRWLTGAKELPWYWWLIFIVFGSFFPAVIFIGIIRPELALILYSIKFILQSVTILYQFRLHRLSYHLTNLVQYEVYTITLTLLTAFYMILPVKLNWKNRYY